MQQTVTIPTPANITAIKIELVALVKHTQKGVQSDFK